MSSAGIARANLGNGAGAIGVAPELTAADGGGRTPWPPPPQPATDSPMKATAAARTQSSISDTYYSVLAPRDCNDEACRGRLGHAGKLDNLRDAGIFVSIPVASRSGMCTSARRADLRPGARWSVFRTAVRRRQMLGVARSRRSDVLGASGISNQGRSPDKQIRWWDEDATAACCPKAAVLEKP
jgi:hypothetical protein